MLTAHYILQAGIAASNPLAYLPKLKGLDGHAGFEFVDPDGVYRTYIANGTVIDAARLTAAQIQTWIDARAPHLSEVEGNQRA